MSVSDAILMLLLIIFSIDLTAGQSASDSTIIPRQMDELAGKTMKELPCNREYGNSPTKWLKNGVDFIPSTEDWVVVDRDTMEQQPRLQVTSEGGLLFRVVRVEDSGDYDCVSVSSSRDALPDDQRIIRSRYRLLVRDAPSPPGVPRAHLISSRNITLIWQGAIPNNSPVQHYLVIVEPQLNKFDASNDAFSLEPSSGGNDGDRSDEQRGRQRRIRTPDNATTFTVTNLFPFTTYTFQLIAVSAVDHSRPSPVSDTMQTLTEPPSGAPVLIVANSTSSSSIRLQWLPPSQHDWHGSLKGYRLFYRRTGSEQTEEILLDNPQAQTYEIRKLKAGRRYFISVQAFNDDGYSPAHTEVVSTLEGEPSAPRNLLIKGVTNTTVSLAWLPPVHFNGLLLGYKIHSTHPAGFVDTKTLPFQTAPSAIDSEEDGGTGSRSSDWIFYRLNDLQPFTSYHIRVSAFTAKGEGPYSASAVNVLTDVTQPGSPQILNVTRVADNALLVEWSAPREVFRRLDFYVVEYSQASVRGEVVDVHQLQVNSSSTYPDSSKTRALDDHLGSGGFTRFPVEQAVITNLSRNHVYHIKVSAVTKSIVDGERVFRGEPSLTFSVNMDAQTTVSYDGQDFFEPVAAPPGLSMTEMVVIVVIVLLIGLAAVVCGLFCALRKRFCLGTYTYLAPNSPKCDEKISGFPRSPTLENTYLSVAQLPAHIKKLYADGQIGLSKEFESLATALQCGDFSGSLKEAQRPENRPKNRYINVLAYDHSRVKLKHVWNCEAEHKANGEEGGDCGCSPRSSLSKTPVYDYINANLVDSFDLPSAYIVTQAPMTNTLVDFWSMVWDYKVRVLIMLTNLEENGRKKCEQYWPGLSEGTRRYGPYTVTITSESTTAFYIVRTFAVTSTTSGNGVSVSGNAEDTDKPEVRQVVQYLYSDWPDHGRPDVTVPLLRFVMKSSRSFEDESAGPPIVHCSAGVGRSGCYIALHSMMLQIDRTGHVDIFQYLLNSRKQRMALCQNESQYALIYDALLEYVQSDQTEVYVATFDEYVDGLLKDNGRALRQQHALINSDTGTETGGGGATCEYANEPYNKGKNRSADFLPADERRVMVTMTAGMAGSEYINASYLPSYRHLKQFIVTQYPLPSTVDTFWQMIWDYRIRHVVILDPGKFEQPENVLSTGRVPRFWPTAVSQPMTVSDTFQVTFDRNTPAHATFSCTECTLSAVVASDRADRVAFVCQLLMATTEMTADCAPGLTELFEHLDEALSRDVSATEVVAMGRRLTNSLVVMDEYGGNSAALFCGLMTIRQQGLAEGSVDIYQTARLYSQSRPGVFSTIEAYREFHEAARSVCQQVAECMPVEQFCFAGSILHPSSPSHLVNASKRLSSILEQEEQN
ncbi:Tyrosine-protein phosphatase 99A [Hypsibius exemplaris]|uniref:protein-tyrosine-phosphatase n=1 Tax=Hypsibius exemplaris TaxID=2072580 RepID=A0A1W0WW41_HYPEX|nr:Tyrosine-protein phosphatase 99A [Hypsibius exemplaris]